jgi:hypothetical protein
MGHFLIFLSVVVGATLFCGLGLVFVLLLGAVSDTHRRRGSY